MASCVNIVFVLAFISIGSYGATNCPDAWTAYEGSCYLSYHSVYNFHDAEDKCEVLGGRLVHIETAAENTFIKSFVGDLTAPTHWIGLEDGVVEGVWKWHGTDTVATFTSWAPGEPNQGSGTNCGAIYKPFHLNWVVEPCTNRKNRPLCERRPIVDEVIG